MQTLIKKLSDGSDFIFDSNDGQFTFKGKKTNQYANTMDLRNDAKEINGVMITHILQIDCKFNVGLSKSEANLTQSLINDYRAKMRALHAPENARKRALNLLMSEGHDDGFDSIGYDNDHINSAA